MQTIQVMTLTLQKQSITWQTLNLFYFHARQIQIIFKERTHTNASKTISASIKKIQK